ncbi:hypothetical protein [Nostoc sp.]
MNVFEELWDCDASGGKLNSQPDIDGGCGINPDLATSTVER